MVFSMTLRKPKTRFQGHDFFKAECLASSLPETRHVTRVCQHQLSLSLTNCLGHPHTDALTYTHTDTYTRAHMFCVISYTKRDQF